MEATVAKRHVAESIAERFAKLPYVHGVCLFGSVARGRSHDWSDIDLLVIGQEDRLRPTWLLKQLPPPLNAERVSLICYSPDQFRQLGTFGSSFIDHLRKEGEVLYDQRGILHHVLGEEVDVRVTDELENELARLSLYDDLRIYKANFLFPLARLYSVGKSVVILALVAHGHRVYEREAAFGLLRKLRPDLATDVDEVARLRPFYRLVTRRGQEALPFPYRNAEQEVRSAVEAIRRLATAAATK
jgi:predicted nucleotidyltransferase